MSSDLLPRTGERSYLPEFLPWVKSGHHSRASEFPLLSFLVPHSLLLPGPGLEPPVSSEPVVWLGVEVGS